MRATRPPPRRARPGRRRRRRWCPPGPPPPSAASPRRRWPSWRRRLRPPTDAGDRRGGACARPRRAPEAPRPAGRRGARDHRAPSRTPGGRRRAPRPPRRAARRHEAPAPVDGCQQRGEHRGAAHGIGGPGVDPADERVGEATRHLGAQPLPHRRAHGHIHSAPAVGGSAPRRGGAPPGEVERRPGEAGGREDPGPCQRSQPGGHAEGQAGGQRPEPAPGEYVGASAPRRHELVLQAELPTQRQGLGPPGQERVGAEVHPLAVDLPGAHLPAEPVARLEDDDPDPRPCAGSGGGQRPGRRQPGDPPAHYHHGGRALGAGGPVHGAVPRSRLRCAPRRRRRRRRRRAWRRTRGRR